MLLNTLFYGPSGSGKYTLAMNLLKQLFGVLGNLTNMLMKYLVLNMQSLQNIL